MANSHDDKSEEERDEILKRMLKTPPKPKGGKPKDKPESKKEKPAK